MSSEAAQKAYPSKADESIADRVRKVVQREAFDKGAQHGAVEALRQEAADMREAYSEVIFKPLGTEDLTKAHEALTAVRLTLDAVSAQVMRFAADSLEKRADKWEAGR